MRTWERVFRAELLMAFLRIGHKVRWSWPGEIPLKKGDSHLTSHRICANRNFPHLGLAHFVVA